MKQNRKNFIFSNFNKQHSSKLYVNELVPNTYYNIDANSETITPAIGFKELLNLILTKEQYINFYNLYSETISSFTRVEIYEYYESLTDTYKIRLFLIDTKFKLYEYLFDENLIVDLEIQFDSFPKIIIETNVLHFYDNTILCFVDSSSAPIISTTSCNIKTYSILRKSIYFVDKSKKYNIYIGQYSALSNLPKDLSNYGYISVNPCYGEILKLINIKGKIYIFQQYKISYLEISANYCNIIDTCNINTKIFAETIASNDYYIYFLTTAGLFIFDGNDIKNIFTSNSSRIVSGNDDKGVVYNGNYYLKTKYTINDVFYNTLLCFNLNNDNPTIYKLGNISDIYITKTNSYYLMNIELNSSDKYNHLVLYNNSMCSNGKYMRFNKISFGLNVLKHISGLKIFNIGKAKIRITSDIESREFTFENNYYINNLNLMGYIFEVEVYSDYTFCLESIIIDLFTLEESYD